MTFEQSTDLALDPREAVRRADLHYVEDAEPGFRRKRWGRGFTYLDEQGNHIRDPELRERLEKLAIPPAWTDVWICPDPAGHIQATGRDDKGRKQYIYHPRWEEARQEIKFKKLAHFAAMLPALRGQVDQDLRRHHFPREKLVALVVSLLDETLIRVGNAEYAENNDSYGLTTMRVEHLSVNGTRARFTFAGKGGKEHDVVVRNRRLVRHLCKCQELPGPELFQYENGEGRYRAVTSGDVNDYLAKHMHEAFSAKDFRTWGATVRAAQALAKQAKQQEAGSSDKAVKKRISKAIEEVAAALGNTKSISRDYYVHPAVLAAYEEGELQEVWVEEPGAVEGLSADEARVLRLVRRAAGIED